MKDSIDVMQILEQQLVYEAADEEKPYTAIPLQNFILVGDGSLTQEDDALNFHGKLLTARWS